jgi:hypothetical protein
VSPLWEWLPAFAANPAVAAGAAMAESAATSAGVGSSHDLRGRMPFRYIFLTCKSKTYISFYMHKRILITAYDNAALFLDQPRIVGEGLGAADPDLCEFRMQGIEKKVRFDMNYRTRNGQNGTCF